MIDRKDLKVGLVTEEGCEVTAIGKILLLYTYNNVEHFADIDSFCNNCSIKKEKVEVIRWVNVHKGSSRAYTTKEDAERYAEIGAIAVAVKMVGSYVV